MGNEPTFSHLSVWYEPDVDTDGGGWHRDMQYVFPDEEEEKERILSGHGYGSGDSRFSGVQVQCALLDGSQHIEYVPGSHARWDTDEEYAVRKLDDKVHRFEPMPGAIRPVLNAGDAFAFTDGLHRGWYEAEVPRRTIMFTLSNGRRARGLDYFSFQPWFQSQGYLDGLSPSALKFYDRYLDEYGEEMAEAIGLMEDHPEGLEAAYREVRAQVSSSNSLPEATREWHAALQGQAAAKL